MTISTRAFARAAYFAMAVAAPVVTFAPTVALAQAAVDIDVTVPTPPPPLVEYDQPRIPAAGYIWTPGYWSWDQADNDYYWIAGEWVRPPRVGVLWTPGYWAWDNGGYVFNEGYWGDTVGYYGGIDYGYGYTSEGYFGGRWQGDRFEYNRAVNNISDVNIAGVYNEPAPRSSSETRASFNGGQGGASVRPTQQQMAAGKAEHVRPTSEQTMRMRTAQQDREAHFKANQGKPSMMGMSKPGEKPMKGSAEANPKANGMSEKPSMKAEQERPGEKPAMKAEQERPGEKPAMKAEEQPQKAQKAVERAPPEKMEAPKAAQGAAQHPAQAQAAPKGEPKKNEAP